MENFNNMFHFGNQAAEPWWEDSEARAWPEAEMWKQPWVETTQGAAQGPDASLNAATQAGGRWMSRVREPGFSHSPDMA